MYTKAFTFLVCGFLLSSCGGSGNKTSQDSEQGVEGTSLYDSPGFTDKYNKYIRFQNNGNKQITRGNSYFFRFDPNQPVGRNNQPNMSYNKTNIKLLLETAELKPDFGKADTEAKLLYQHAKTVDSLLTVAKFYYEKKAYEEDQFEKGKALRAQMEPAMKAYTEHYGNFAAAMDVLSKDLTERELKKFKDDDRMGHYYMLSNINCAEAMFEYIDNNAEDNFSGVSIEELDKFLTDFNKSLTELEQLSMNEEEFKKEFGIKSMQTNLFIKESSGLFVAVKEFKKRIETKNWKFKITHPNIPDEGSYEKISKTYESLIQRYNSAI